MHKTASSQGTKDSRGTKAGLLWGDVGLYRQHTLAQGLSKGFTKLFFDCIAILDVPTQTFPLSLHQGSDIHLSLMALLASSSTLSGFSYTDVFLNEILAPS